MEYGLSKSGTSGLRAEDLYNYHVARTENILTKFMNWCEAQQSNFFLWLALAFIGQIGMTLPLTAVFIVFFGGNSLVLWSIIAVVNIPVLVLNLGAMPTKTTLPFMFFSWLTQAVIILYSISFFLMH